MAEQGSRMLRRVVALIERPEAERTEEEMELLIPWLAKIATPFQALEKDKMMTLLRYCNYEKVPRDHVIIRQGDFGDCFHVMLSGKSSLYIDMSALDDLDKDGAGEGHGDTADADTWEEVWDRSGKRCLRLDRSKFGGYITSYDAGKGFGEMALFDAKSARSGSIIADEECELLIIDQRLFNDTLKERQEAERKKRWAFIENSPLFSNWQSKMKRLLDMSLVQKVFPFDCYVVRQGQPVAGLHFIIRGEALVTVDSGLHPLQYPKVFDKRMEILTELNKNAEKKEATSKKDSQFLREQIRRPEVGHVTAHRRPLSSKCQNICAIEQSEVIGALEFVSGLDTYAQTVVSKSDLELFVLDSRSIDRLFSKAKHTSTYVYLVERVQERLNARLTFGSGSKVELYRHLLSILDERKWKESLDRKSRPKKEVAFSTKSDLIDPNLRGSAMDDRTGQQTARPDDHQRLISGHRLAESNMNPPGHALPLTAYYNSNVTDRTKGFSQAYLSSRVGGYGRQHMDLSEGGKRLLMDRATRLLPRSRRELEHIALGLKDAKPRPKINQYRAIQRYLSSPQTTYIDPEKLDLVRALVQETVQTTATDDARASDAAHPGGTDRAAHLNGTVRSAQSSGMDRNVHLHGTGHSAHSNGTLLAFNPNGTVHFAAHSSGTGEAAHPRGTVRAAHSRGTGGGRRSSESEEEEVEITLSLEETVSNERLRSVALKIGDYHQELNEERKQNIFFSVFDGRRVADKKQSVVSKMTRSKMTPGSTKMAFDKESSDETLTLVEDKLRRFYSDLDTSDSDSPVVQQLRRFRIATADDAPIPAGTVYVCRRCPDNATSSRCCSNLSNEIYNETGEAANNRPKIRRYMIPKTAYPLLINAFSKHDADGEKELRKQSCVS